jgi:hypothetical protein
MITCDWSRATLEARAKFPDATAYHDAHGADLSDCDSWLCECGNRPDLDGFDTVDGAPELRYRCARCARVYTAGGVER